MDQIVGNLPNIKLAATNLEQGLKEAPIGAVYTYPELSEMAGVENIADPKVRCALETAKRNLLKHHGILLVNIRGSGYRICEPGQFHMAAASYRVKGTKSFKQAKKILDVVDLSAMTEEERTQTLKEAGKNQLLLIASKITGKEKLSKAIDYTRPPTEESVLKFLMDKSQSTNKAKA